MNEDIRPQEIIRPKFGEERDSEIRELSKRVNRIEGIEFAPGFEEYAAISPKFEQQLKDRVRLRFSRGKNAPNMSAVHVDETNNETPEGNLENFKRFRQSQGFEEPPNVVHVIGNFQGTHYQIQEVSSESFDNPNIDFDSPTNLVVSGDDPEVIEKEQLNVRTNFIFTRDPDIVLAIKPADCPIVVGYCKDKYGNDLIFYDHSGADACNAGLSYQGMLYLRDELGVDLSTVKVTILPGVSKENYDISNEPERRGNGIVEESWKEFIDDKYPDYIVEGKLVSEPGYRDMSEDEKERKRAEIRNGQKRHVDITEATVWQLLDAGLTPENIEAILDDSYEAAKRGEAHSHRFTMQNNGKNKGRDVVMYQLVGDKKPIDSDSLSKAA